jgi:hypothetical protein
MTDYFNSLVPDELLLAIFSLLYEESPGLLIPSAAVCRRWQSIAKDRSFIHSLLPHWNVNVLLSGVGRTYFVY